VITCSALPGVLRVEYTAYEDDTERRRAVCFLRPTDTGQIDILYSHHIDQNRPGDKGPWQTHEFKMALSPALLAEISANVMYEFWNAYGFRVKDLPKGLDVPTPYIDFGGETKFHGKHVKQRNSAD
jgi:hypothetical protein